MAERQTVDLQDVGIEVFLADPRSNNLTVCGASRRRVRRCHGTEPKGWMRPWTPY
jgi:hypothetical protein